jgi:hypothetical protein
MADLQQHRYCINTEAKSTIECVYEFQYIFVQCVVHRDRLIFPSLIQGTTVRVVVGVVPRWQFTVSSEGNLLQVRFALTILDSRRVMHPTALVVLYEYATPVYTARIQTWTGFPCSDFMLFRSCLIALWNHAATTLVLSFGYRLNPLARSTYVTPNRGP